MSPRVLTIALRTALAAALAVTGALAATGAAHASNAGTAVVIRRGRLTR